MEEHRTEESREDDPQKSSMNAVDDGSEASAAYLPYDDSRLWVRMPDADRRGTKKPRRAKRRESEPHGSADATPGAERRSTGRALLLSGMVAAAALVAVYVLLPGWRLIGSEAPAAPDATMTAAALAPSAATSLRTIEASKKGVTIGWSGPDAGGPYRYVVYRDSVQIGETSNETFVDYDVAIDNYYRYVIIVVGPDGSPSEPSSELLVPILRPGQEMATPTLAPLPPPVYLPAVTITKAATSPVATKTPPPSPLKTPSPSVRTIYETQYVTMTQTVVETVQVETTVYATVTETVVETVTVAP